MNATRVDVRDLCRGDRVIVSGEPATVTKIRRPPGAYYLAVTYVDDRGVIIPLRYKDRPQSWTVDVLT